MTGRLMATSDGGKEAKAQEVTGQPAGENLEGNVGVLARSDRLRDLLMRSVDEQLLTRPTGTADGVDICLVAGASVDLADFLRLQGLEVIDKRAAGGVLWVIGDMQLKKPLDGLKNKGHRFTFAKGGGRATKHRPAWYIK